LRMLVWRKGGSLPGSCRLPGSRFLTRTRFHGGCRPDVKPLLLVRPASSHHQSSPMARKARPALSALSLTTARSGRYRRSCAGRGRRPASFAHSGRNLRAWPLRASEKISLRRALSQPGHRDDIASALFLLASSPNEHGIVNVSDDQPLTQPKCFRTRCFRPLLAGAPDSNRSDSEGGSGDASSVLQAHQTLISTEPAVKRKAEMVSMSVAPL
jgi:hypothetical protein